MSRTDLCEHESKMVTSPRGEASHGLYSAVNTIRLRIGDVCCAFKCQDNEVHNRLKQLYSVFLTEQAGDITVEMEATERLSMKDLGKVLSRTRYIHEKGNQFRTTSKIVSGEYDLRHRYIKIIGEKSLADPDSEFNHLNKLLSLAYYSACQVKYGNTPPAMLVHACGILRHGHAMLFTGSSKAGKTTIASLCGEQDGEVINDEILLVSRPNPDGNSIIVRSAPIIGKFPPQRVITAPLHSILLLKQSDKTLVSRVDRTEAYLRLMRQVITPAYIGQRDKREILSLIADFSTEVIASIPVYELEFTLDRESLWRVVGEFEREVSREERQ